MANIAALLLLYFAVYGNARNISLVLVDDAISEGAVCLDGSAPGYYIGRGSGSGADKWILHQGGGGWCDTAADCLERSRGVFGSSSYWNSSVDIVGGIFSDDEAVNGEFYNWNVVYLGYCDGGSFAGYLEDPLEVDGTKLYIRGRPILLALIEHLMQNGMQNATDVILTGCSAGGLATFLHADLVSSLLPEDVSYKAMSDGGYFLNIPAVNGLMLYEFYMRTVFALHNTSGGSDSDCAAHFSGAEGWKCLFAPFTFEFIKSPIFVLNSLYDTAQLAGILGLDCLPPDCDDQQQFVTQLAPALDSSAGIFADSCLIHCQTLEDKPWATYAVGGKTMREAFEDWYFEKSSEKYQEVDCPFPCNPTCPVDTGTGAGSTNRLGSLLFLLFLLVLYI
jgi:hypothetical protein